MNSISDWYIDLNGNRCKQYKTYEDLLNDLKPNAKTFNFLGHGIFRGQAKDWPLIPSLYREIPDKYLDIEHSMNDESIKTCYNYSEYIDLRKFYKKANDIGLEVPISEALNRDYLQDDYSAAFFKIGANSNDGFFEDANFRNLAALAQHYGIKTRLLDWSRNIFVSLYFAARKSVDEILQDSSCINENMVIWGFPSDFAHSTATNVYKPPIKFVVPDYNKNPNIYAQQGVLMYWDNSNLKNIDKFQEPFDVKVDKFYRDVEFKNSDGVVRFSKIFLPIKECTKILEHIDKIGYNAYTLFPWYNGIVESIKEESSIQKCEDIIKANDRIEKNSNNYADNKIVLKCSDYKVSAGNGFILDEIDKWHEIEAEATYTAHIADFCLEISGDSMEPKFSDGDIVLIRKDAEINIGDVGIFELNGEGYIKERGEDCWISLNPEYDNVYVTENDNYKCFGKVIGKAKQLLKI